MKQCPMCQVDESPENKFKVCSGCRAVFFCSQTCQRGFWPQHRPSCKVAQWVKVSPRLQPRRKLAQTAVSSLETYLVIASTSINRHSSGQCLAPPGFLRNQENTLPLHLLRTSPREYLISPLRTRLYWRHPDLGCGNLFVWTEGGSEERSRHAPASERQYQDLGQWRSSCTGSSPLHGGR